MKLSKANLDAIKAKRLHTFETKTSELEVTIQEMSAAVSHQKLQMAMKDGKFDLEGLSRYNLNVLIPYSIVDPDTHEPFLKANDVAKMKIEDVNEILAEIEKFNKITLEDSEDEEEPGKDSET
jgi:hypothetical protein